MNRLVKPRIRLPISAAAVLFVVMLAACSPNRASTTNGSETSPDPSPSAEGGAGSAEEGGVEASGEEGGAGGQAPKNAPPPAKGGSLAQEAIQPTAPGGYLYDEAGEVTINCGAPQKGAPPTPTTLQVNATDGNRQRSIRDRSGGGQEFVVTQDLEFRKEGIFLAYHHQRQKSPFGTDEYEFAPNPAPLALPAKPTQGQAWQYSITSKDKRLTVDISNTVEALSEQVTLQSGAVKAARVKSTRHATGSSSLGSVDLTEENLTWISYDHRLAVREISNASGKIGVSCSTTQHIESVLRSTAPA